jgi:hypothetical protein
VTGAVRARTLRFLANQRVVYACDPGATRRSGAKSRHAVATARRGAGLSELWRPNMTTWLNVHANAKARRRRGFAVGAVALVAFATLLGLLSAGPAYAYTYSWGADYAECRNRPPYWQCYDGRGDFYNPWIELQGGIMHLSGSYNGMCMKAVTKDGRTRSGTPECTSALNGSRCLSGPTPESWAYVYWGGSGQAHIYGSAATPGSSGCP